jgi:acyl-CoA reductase-like NAD-dependent aldehyde dehydrogenase
MSDRWHRCIGGQGQAPTSGEYINSFDPYDGRTVAAGDDVDIARAVGSAATSDWRNCRPIERGRILLALREMPRRSSETP